MTRRFALLFAVLFLVSCTVGGAPNQTLHLTVTASPTGAAAFPTSITDFQGRSVAISESPIGVARSANAKR